MTRSILLVDDEEPILFALSDYLAAEGWEVRAARELEEAEALLATQRFAAAIADLRLTAHGGADGLRILETIHARYPKTRVVLLTGYSSPEVETRARALGVDCILHKPQPLAFIAGIITHLVDGREARACPTPFADGDAHVQEDSLSR